DTSRSMGILVLSDIVITPAGIGFFISGIPNARHTSSLLAKHTGFPSSIGMLIGGEGGFVFSVVYFKPKCTIPSDDFFLSEGKLDITLTLATVNPVSKDFESRTSNLSISLYCLIGNDFRSKNIRLISLTIPTVVVSCMFST